MHSLPTRLASTVLLTCTAAVVAAVVQAAPAAAINPCSGDNPPSTCFRTPPPPAPPAPSAPTGVAVRVVARTAVTISWLDTSTTESVFQVVRTGANQSPAFTVPGRAGSGGTRSFTDTTAAPGTSYTYSVRAIRYGSAKGQASGVSGYASVAATTDATNSAVNLGLPMPVGNQGGLDDCSAWAADYYLRGWYAARDGYYPVGGFAPTYTYAQYDHGRNGGTTIDGNLSIQLQNGANGLPGLDTVADYAPGLYDSTTQPTGAEAANAARYRIASIASYFGPNLRASIQNSLSGGQPLALAIDVFPEFMPDAGPTLIGAPPAGERSIGGHSVFAYAFDANGVWIANQWSTYWRQGGTAELSWAFVDSHVGAAFGATPVTPAGA